MSPVRALPRGAGLALIALAVAAGPFLLGWVSLARNRLLSPATVPLPPTPGTLAAAGVFLAGCAALAAVALRPPPWRMAAEAAAVIALVALVAAAGLAAAAVLPEGTSTARAGPAAGTWAAGVLLALAAAACAARRGASPAGPLLAAAAVITALGTLGVLDSLSLVREAAGRGADLRDALLGHVALSLAALGLALLLGVPLALLSLGRPRLEAGFLAVASGVQVVPSIALFGLLIAPLAALANAVPALRALGVGGIGPAPGVLAIAGYLLLPLARGVLAGLRVAPPVLLDAARGQGLSERGVMWGLRLPLGAGVMLGALRVAAVQAVGLATLAALVGGGGLGTLVFQGIGQLAGDLILLGILPILALSLAADAGFGALARLLPAPA